LDLDRFKAINDSLGHTVADKLLQSVATRLVNCVRGSDTVSRQGGDEFIILLPEIKDAADAGIAAGKILNALAEQHRVDQHRVALTASAGISVYPQDGDDTECLIKNADAAMYRAKRRGGNNYQFFRNALPLTNPLVSSAENRPGLNAVELMIPASRLCQTFGKTKTNESTQTKHGSADLGRKRVVQQSRMLNQSSE
jgi:diguanylate cyclase (GGDEF)-like protein